MADQTIKKASIDAQKPKREANTNLVDFIYTIGHWLQANIAPPIALVVMGITTADDIKIHLAVQNAAHHSIEFGLVVGIGVAALLVLSSCRCAGTSNLMRSSCP